MRSAAYFDDESRGSRVLSWLAHALVYLLPVAVVVRVVSWFGLVSYVNVSVAAALCGCWIACLLHRRTDHLCARCMDTVPADAPTLAERRRGSLRFAHFVTTVPGILCLVAAFVTPLAASAALPETVARLTFIPSDLWTFAMIYTEWTHHRLRPWCPYCGRWDDFGDHEPSPDPTLSNSRK